VSVALERLPNQYTAGVKNHGRITDRQLWILLGITLLGATLRFVTLGVQSFSHDEAVTVHRVIQSNFFATLSVIPLSESTPQLYYILGWIWTRIFSESEIGIRSLSALVGTLTVPLVWVTAKQIVSGRTALIAALLVAVNPFLVWYSQEARAYSLLVFLSIASILFFVKAQKEKTNKTFFFWVLTSFLSLSTHYFAVFLIATEALLLAITVRSRRTFVAIAGLVIAGATLLPIAVKQAKSGHTNWIADFPLFFRIKNLAMQFLLGETGITLHWQLLVAIGSVLLAGILLLSRTQKNEKLNLSTFALLGVAGIILPSVLVAFGVDFFWSRNLIPALIPLLIVLAGGFCASKAQAIGLPICVIFVAISGYASVATAMKPKLQRTDWRLAVSMIQPNSNTGPRAVIVSTRGDDPLELYLSAMKFPKQGAKVKEIDIIGWKTTNRDLRLRKKFPSVKRIASGRAKLLTVERFQTDTPVQVTVKDLKSLYFGGGKSAVLYVNPRPF